jgi:hypothetical protein
VRFDLAEIRSGQSGDLGVMYSNGEQTVSCRQLDGKIEYLVTSNERIRPLLNRLPVIRTMERLRLMFRNTHPHVQFLKSNGKAETLMPFYLRFTLFLLVVAPVYILLMWLVKLMIVNMPFFWLELLIEAVFMYGLFMLLASNAMSTKSKRYHSAEHQVVNARRTSKGELKLAEIRNASRFHASCGTGAAFSVAVGVFFTLLLIYNLIPPPAFIDYVLLNLLLFPIGVSVGLELFWLIPFLYRKTGITLLVYPSFLLQRFTTNIASDNELEVARSAAEHLLKLSSHSSRS